MFDKLTTRAMNKVRDLQIELDEAKAKIAALEAELNEIRAAYRACNPVPAKWSPDREGWDA